MLLGADTDGRDAFQQAVAGALEPRHQAAGSVSVPSGCGAVPDPTIRPESASTSSTLVDWVDESTPATSVVSPCDSTTMAGV